MGEHKKPSAKAVRLLRRVVKHILEEPRRFVMSQWVVRNVTTKSIEKGLAAWVPELDEAEKPPIPPCGTVACIAGWTALLGTPKGKRAPQRARIQAAAERMLEFKSRRDSMGYVARDSDRLFYEDEWPEPYQGRYLDAETPEGRARIAAQRIEHFIKTGE